VLFLVPGGPSNSSIASPPAVLGRLGGPELAALLPALLGGPGLGVPLPGGAIGGAKLTLAGGGADELGSGAFSSVGGPVLGPGGALPLGVGARFGGGAGFPATGDSAPAFLLTHRLRSGS
jgi:hypothetical protein